MQAQGYTIVAVEQTVNSQSLYEFRFPEKTLLLLGLELKKLSFPPIRTTRSCIETRERIQFHRLENH